MIIDQKLLLHDERRSRRFPPIRMRRRAPPMLARRRWLRGPIAAAGRLLPTRVSILALTEVARLIDHHMRLNPPACHADCS